MYICIYTYIYILHNIAYLLCKCSIYVKIYHVVWGPTNKIKFNESTFRIRGMNDRGSINKGCSPHSQSL